MATIEGKGSAVVRVLVTGANGQLGSALVDLLQARGDDVLGADLPDLDIVNPVSVAQAFQAFAPEVVINCAAFTAVDDAESQESLAMAINAEGPRVLATQCLVSGAWLVHISTDYVFSGQACTPYSEDAPGDPKSAYGRTKWAGEQAVRSVLPDASYIVRTAWLYGLTGNNFVKTMVRMERERDTVSVVTDQIGQPTFAADLAAQIVQLLHAHPPAGTFHATNSGQCSWFEFAQAIFRQIGADPDRVLPTDSASFTRPAPRPSYSVLGHEQWIACGMLSMQPWSKALDDAFAAGIGR